VSANLYIITPGKQVFKFYDLLAALTEIAGCYAFWMWVKLGKSPLWLLPGVCSLCAFRYLLTFIESAYAGRAYAFYGAVYIAGSLLWMWAVEGNKPDVFDLSGMALCCLGAGLILFAPR
jgi:small multidrug resistance family-3 protein